MKILSFNINSIRARIHQLEAILELHDPDVIGLQETKVHDANFPFDAIKHLGYHTEIHGQKGHYGVALLSKQKPSWVQKGFVDDAGDAQKRMIMGRYTSPSGKPYSVLNGYFPQGESADHEIKYPAKRKFFADLVRHLASETKKYDSNADGAQIDPALVVMGDFNVAFSQSDIGIGAANAKRWLRAKKCSFLPEERQWMQNVLDCGLADTYRLQHPAVDDRFSWFDYRSRGFEAEPKRGLRIDGVLASAELQARLVAADICYVVRGMDKPSDHAPIWAEFDFA